MTANFADNQALASMADRLTKGRIPAALLCACASLLLYLLLPSAVSKLSSAEPSFASEIFSWVKPVTRASLTALQDDDTNDIWPAVRFLACCAALFALYGFLLHLVKGRQPFLLQLLVFASGAAFLLSFLIAPVLLSTDVFSYALYGRIFSAYGSNPYLANRSFSFSDPFFAMLHHKYVPSVYGPFWTLLSAGVTRIAGVRLGLTVFLFRVLACAAVLSSAALIWSSLLRYSPERATQGLALFLWNPLVVIESGLSGHNDTAMVAFLMLGVWLHVRGHKTGAVAAFTLSALVKFVTGALVPLYVLMVLREASGWRERALLLLRGGLAAGVVMAAVILFARVSTDLPAAHYASSPQFYSNNFHELILTRVRRLLGEDAASVQVPVTFGSYWVAASTEVDLLAAPSEQAAHLAHFPPSRQLIVIAPQRGDDWLRVFDPVSRQKGYVDDQSVDEIDDPDGADSDPVVVHVEETLLDWPKVQRANALVHNVAWSLFAVFGLAAAWRTKNFDGFLLWSAAVMLASYYLVMTQFWPWYVLWAVALGAMKPDAIPAKFAVWLSASVLTLYVTLGYEETDSEWIYTYRSLPAVVFPLILFALLYCCRRFRLRQLPGWRLVESGSL